jgi:hypothetical protein
MAHKPLLKQFGDLSRDDFAAHPVWISVHTADYGEPWYDETDEETFRPWTGPLPVGPEEGMLLVRSRFTLADARALQGFVTPQHEAEPANLGVMQPQLFLPSGKLGSFWDGMFQRPAEAREILYVELGKDPQAIFPIRFSADEGLATGRVEGSIPGFCWCPKGAVQVYH